MNIKLIIKPIIEVDAFVALLQSLIRLSNEIIDIHSRWPLHYSWDVDFVKWDFPTALWKPFFFFLQRCQISGLITLWLRTKSVDWRLWRCCWFRCLKKNPVEGKEYQRHGWSVMCSSTQRSPEGSLPARFLRRWNSIDDVTQWVNKLCALCLLKCLEMITFLEWWKSFYNTL